MSDSFSVKGFDEIASNLRKQAESMKDRVNNEILSFANDVYQSSQSQVPIDEGNLKSDSGVEQDKSNLSATIYYGRSSAEPYAIAVHENPSEHDPPTWKGKQIQFTHGGSKFLERPLNDAKKDFESRMAKAVLGE